MKYVKEIQDTITGEPAVVWDWDNLWEHTFYTRGDKDIGHAAYNKATKAAVQDDDLRKFIALRPKAETSGKTGEPHIRAASSERFITSLYDKLDGIKLMSDTHLKYLALASDEVHDGQSTALQLVLNPLLLKTVSDDRVFSTRALLHNLKSYPTPRPRLALNRALDLHEDRRIAPFFLTNAEDGPYLRADIEPMDLGKNLLKVGREHSLVNRSLRIGEVVVGGFVQCLEELMEGRRFMTPEEFFGDSHYL